MGSMEQHVDGRMEGGIRWDKVKVRMQSPSVNPNESISVAVMVILESSDDIPVPVDKYVNHPTTFADNSPFASQ